MVRSDEFCVRKGNPPRWPEVVNIPIKKGLLLSIILFFAPKVIVSTAIHLGLDNDVDSFEDGINLIILYIFVSIFVFSLIRWIGRISIRKMLFSRIPTVLEIVIWSGVGLMLGSVRILASLREGYRFEEPLFFLFMLGAIIFKSILFPLVEEPIYRGIVLVTLYNWKRNRVIAYIGSAFIFWLYHALSFPDWGFQSLSYLHIVLIISFSFIAAYLYDRKGNILLCMLVHGIPNGSDFLGGLLGYLLDVGPPS